MLHWIFSALVGKYAPAVSGFLGILGSIALAIPAFASRNMRTVLLQLDDIEIGISPEAYVAAKRTLTREARRLLAKERRWNLAGAILLVSAFLILFLNAIYCAVSPSGTCS
jgi:hypothetical protein